MSMLHSILDALRDLVDRLHDAHRGAVEVGEALFERACKTGDASALEPAIAYIRCLDLLGNQMARLDKVCIKLMRAKKLTTNLEVVTLIDALEAVFVPVDDLFSKTKETTDSVLAVVEAKSQLLSDLITLYENEFADLKQKSEPEPEAEKVAAPQLPTSDSAPATPVDGLAASSLGEDFESAVDAASSAVAPVPPSRPTPPQTQTP